MTCRLGGVNAGRVEPEPMTDELADDLVSCPCGSKMFLIKETGEDLCCALCQKPLDLTKGTDKPGAAI